MANPLTCYLGELSAAGPIGVDIDRGEERRLLALAATDGAARWEVTRMNVPLAARFAASYARCYPTADLMDLVQEGTWGLYEAAGRFDVDRVGGDGQPMRFSTYATPWIKQRLGRYVAGRGRLIPVPRAAIDDAKAWDEAADAGDGSTRTDAEVAATLGYSEARVRRMAAGRAAVKAVATGSGGRLPPERDDPLMHVTAKTEDERGGSDLQDAVVASLATLDPRLRLVVECRYGLDRAPMTLAETGLLLGSTREWVRQLQLQAIVVMKKVVTARMGRKLTPKEAT